MQSTINRSLTSWNSRYLLSGVLLASLLSLSAMPAEARTVPPPSAPFPLPRSSAALTRCRRR